MMSMLKQFLLCLALAPFGSYAFGMHRNGTAVRAIQGDITRQRFDAIVNAANSQLDAGGGICGAIQEASLHI